MKLIKLEKYNCRPCSMVESFLYNAGVEYDKINIEDNPEVAIQYGVMSVPVTLLLDDNGLEVQRVVGFNPPQLNDLISKLNQ